MSKESPGVSVLYGYDGQVINPCIVEGIIRLTYKGQPVNACKYEINERFGLMDLEGRRLSDALYYDVLALTGNLYGGRLTDGKSLAVLNGKGEVIRTQEYIAK